MVEKRLQRVPPAAYSGAMDSESSKSPFDYNLLVTNSVDVKAIK